MGIRGRSGRCLRAANHIVQESLCCERNKNFIPKRNLNCSILILFLIMLFVFVSAFIIATQFFYTVAFILTLIAFGLCLLYGLCCGPDQSRYVKLVGLIGLDLLAAGKISLPNILMIK